MEMKKMYLMKGMALLAMGLVAVSCNKMDFSGKPEVSKEEAFANAEMQLGITIDPNQDWKMTKEVPAEVTVNLGTDQAYTVVIYDKSPLYSTECISYARLDANEGQTVTAAMVLPSALNALCVAVYDSKQRSVVKTATIQDGKLSVVVGDVATRSHRAPENAATYPDFVKTPADFLSGLTEAGMKEYYPITDEIITDYTSQGNGTLTDATWSKGLNGAYIGDGKHFRVAAGTTITEKFHVNGAYGVVNDVVIYVEGTVHFKGNTLNGPTVVVANGGKVIVDSYTSWSNAGRFVILPGGELSGSANLLVANGSRCYNGGTINLTSELNINGCEFYNNGNVTVDALNNQSGGSITNFGKILARTNSGDANTYNCTIINGCYMHFTENAGVGTLTLLDNSRLDVDGQASIAGGVYYGQGAVLYDKSEINAGSIYLNGTKFTGPAGNGTYAVVKTQKMLFGQGADLAAVDNVYFDWNYETGIYNHQDAQDFNCTVDNGYTYLSYVKNQNFNYTNSETSALIIPEGECSGIGNNPGGGGGTIIINNPIYSYAFEDTDLGDYDLNDVVLKATEDDDNITLTLVAAGATLDLNIRLYDYDENGVNGYGSNYVTLQYNDFTEIHDMLNVDHGTMVNTGGNSANVNLLPTFTLSKSNYDAANLRLAIYSESQGEVRLSGSGDTPHGVLIPYDWSWPTERTHITRAYNNTSTSEDEADQSFSNFAQNAGHAEWWFKYPTGSVMKK